MMSPILRDFPESFETKRLLIRAPLPGGGAELNAAILESLDELRPWMPWVQPIPTIEDSEKYCWQGHANFLARRDLPLQLFLKDSGVFVGGSGLHPKDWTVPKFEIGYWCRTRFQGQGYITEAVRGITHFGFEMLGAKRIEIRCDARNMRSRHVAERAGYRLEVELQNDSLSPSGELRNTLIFAMLWHEHHA